MNLIVGSSTPQRTTGERIFRCCGCDAKVHVAGNGVKRVTEGYVPICRDCAAKQFKEGRHVVTVPSIGEFWRMRPEGAGIR